MASLWKARVLWRATTALSPCLGPCHQPCNFDYRLRLYSEIRERSDDEVDVKARASEIFSAMQSKGFIRYSEEDLVSLYQFLLNVGTKSSTIEAQLSETPDLIKFPIDRWDKTCEIMEQNGFSSSGILQYVALCPGILKIKPSALSAKLLQYSQITVGKHNLLAILERYPLLFLSEPSRIKKRVAFIKSFFPPDVFMPLIRNNPNVLLDTWKDVMEKIMYIHKVMGLEQPHIAHSKALRKSLLHIKTRHQFLFRAGVYVTPNLEKDKLSNRRNPPLSDIMDTTDAYFSNRVARLTEYEYKTFSSMMEEEESAYSDSEESDDDDNPDSGYHDLS